MKVRPCKAKISKRSFCSGDCYHRASANGVTLNCKKCGAPFYCARKEAKARKYCNVLCQKRVGKASRTVDGYLELMTPFGRMREHRWVMACHLGRLLEPSEHVHHINGNKTDNRVVNLMVLTASEHSRLHVAQGDTFKKKAA